MADRCPVPGCTSAPARVFSNTRREVEDLCCRHRVVVRDRQRQSHRPYAEVAADVRRRGVLPRGHPRGAA